MMQDEAEVLKQEIDSLNQAIRYKLLHCTRIWLYRFSPCIVRTFFQAK